MLKVTLETDLLINTTKTNRRNEMILILSFLDDPHVQQVTRNINRDNFVIWDLREMGDKSYLEYYPDRASATIHFPGTQSGISSNDVTAVWYRRPKYKRGGDIEEWKRVFAENEERTTLDGLWRCMDHAFWLSDPFAIRMADNKPYQLSLASKIGFNTPPTIITNSPDLAVDFATKHGDIVYKPIAKGRIEKEGVPYLIFLTKKVAMTHLKKEKDKIIVTPCMFQKYIEKQYEIRVTIVGENIFSAALFSQEGEETKTDWRKNPVDLRHERITLPKNVSDMCINMVRSLGLTFGAIDLIYTPEGDYVFLEINPNGQWLWIEDLLGYEISKSISQMLIHGGGTNVRH